MKAMNEVGKLHGQYMLTIQAFDEARREAGEITVAVNARINRDREADRLRLDKLEKISAGGGAAARVASLELDELRGKAYKATAAEASAFDEVIGRAVQAAAELVPLRAQFADAYKAACTELDGLRKQVIGDQLAELRGRWIEGDRQEFEALDRE